MGGIYIKVLSLYDGMSCGQIALRQLGVPVEEYYAYEIDKYAIKVTQHNFPDTIQCGDVFAADFTKHRGVDTLIGGSPCTHWSICQHKDRETTASGIGWDLFSQYVRALEEVQPQWFLYENNKSMAPAIRQQISETFGFEPICINSALLSGQNRERLYWVGRRNASGAYDSVDVQQPQDRGILLADVLDDITSEKCYALKSLTEREMAYMVGDHGNYSDRWTYLQKPGAKDKACCITANIHRGVPYNICAQPVRLGTIENSAKRQDFDSQQYRVYSPAGKSVTLCGCGGGVGAKTGLYLTPVSDPSVVHPVDEVRDGKILFHDEWHPINLPDGYYVIRKLTVDECKRLQTVPDWYDMTCISASQAYKCLGNGWTVEVIMYLIASAMSNKEGL